MTNTLTTTGPGPGCALGKKLNVGPCLQEPQVCLPFPAPPQPLHLDQPSSSCPGTPGLASAGEKENHIPGTPWLTCGFYAPRFPVLLLEVGDFSPPSPRLSFLAAKGLASPKWICGNKGSRMPKRSKTMLPHHPEPKETWPGAWSLNGLVSLGQASRTSPLSIKRCKVYRPKSLLLPEERAS